MQRIINRIIDKLYHDTDGMLISLAERERLQIQDATLTYGEILPETFAQMLEVVKPQKGEVFYDLGAGAGKAVFCAALLNDWRKVCGIELLPGLHQSSKRLLETFVTLPEIQKHFPDQHFPIEFIQADILKADIHDANVIYMHATTWGPLLWEPLSKKLNQLQAGTRVIVNTKQLHEEHFEKISEQAWLMGWGDSMVFTYRKK